MKDKLRVWWSTEEKLRYFYVKDIEDAKLIINALIIREMDDNNISFNAHGLEQINEYDKWEEFYDEDGLDIDEIMEDEDENYNYMFRGE